MSLFSRPKLWDTNKLTVGMYAYDVSQLFGHPTHINRTTTEDIVYEQWVYSLADERVYLYFEDNVLKSWQD